MPLYDVEVRPFPRVSFIVTNSLKTEVGHNQFWIYLEQSLSTKRQKFSVTLLLLVANGHDQNLKY